MIDQNDFPSPQPLLPTLLDAGFSHEIAAAASQLYQQRAEEFKWRTQATLIAAWQKMATLPGASAASLDPLTRKDVSNFTQMYLRCLEEWKEEMVQLLKQASSKGPRKAAPPRNPHSFNHGYLPLLEHFFDENPFPTHADKVFLAKKSNMQYKQIHVWFQNRRNRTKNECKPLRKKPKAEGATKPLDKIYERMKVHVVKPVSRSPESLQIASGACLVGSDDEIRITRNDAQKCAFISPSPAHAFPSSYPPTCAYDPFPCKRGPISFKKPEWRRAPCSKSPPSVSLNIDGLVEHFSRLNVRSDVHIKGSPRSRSPAATAAITVIPPRAPHPSLIVYRHPSVRAPSRCLQNSKPTSGFIASIPISCPCHSEFPVKQKTASLPQRFPSRKQNDNYPTTPSKCCSSLSSSMFSEGSGSRSSSFSSISSSSFPTNRASIQELRRSGCPSQALVIPVFLET